MLKRSQLPIECVNILAKDDPIGPIPVKFRPKGTDPNEKDARFMFHTRRAVQSLIADLLVVIRN